MSSYKKVNIVILFIVFSCLTGCRKTFSNNDYLVSFNDTIKNSYGYKNKNGDIVIADGKYDICFTDTFKTYAIVVKPNVGIIGIDRQENTLYKVVNYDNGPDTVSEGLFRITENNKIGYANAATGAVVIQPQFKCAWPFENGSAKVSDDCVEKKIGEYSTWESNHWYYINKKGKKVKTPSEND